MLFIQKGLPLAGLTGILLFIFSFPASPNLMGSPGLSGGNSTTVSIVIVDDLLRVISSSGDDVIIRIEVWQGNTLTLLESPCGGQICQADLGTLGSGSYLAKGFSQSGASSALEFDR